MPPAVVPRTSGRFFDGFPAGLLPRFLRGQHQHRACAVKPCKLAAVELGRRKRFRQVHFRRDFYALAADIKQRHRPERAASGAEAGRIQLPAQAERRNNACPGDDHSRRRNGQWFERKKHRQLVQHNLIQEVDFATLQCAGSI
jgi:hypothetical protein